jgi:hypothetical protein
MFWTRTSATCTQFQWRLLCRVFSGAAAQTDTLAHAIALRDFLLVHCSVLIRKFLYTVCVLYACAVAGWPLHDQR